MIDQSYTHFILLAPYHSTLSTVEYTELNRLIETNANNPVELKTRKATNRNKQLISKRTELSNCTNADS